MLVASLLLWNSCVCLSSHVALFFTLIFVLDKKAEEGSSSAITEETSANVQQWRRNNLSNTDVEKGQGDVSCQEKALISRSLSLSKLFTPRIKRTSSLPVTPIVLLNSESARGGSSVTPQTPSVSVVLCHCSFV